MRLRLAMLAACAALATGSTAFAAIDSYIKATSEADAASKCGPKPTTPGSWECRGMPEPEHKPVSPQVGSQDAPKITWTWTDGGAPKIDASGSSSSATGWGGH
jgi:hypothetical protein